MKNLASVTLAALLFTPLAWAANLPNAPSGAHYANGSAEPVCTVDQATLNVTCTGTVIGGVGNTNAIANLSVTYSGTVQCRNHGGQVVEVKTQTTEGTSSGKLTPDRNGQLIVPSLTATAPTAADLVKDATCPNGNWTKELLNGPTLVSYAYTLTFAGFTQSAISIVYFAP
jgi:hypothetical protein